MFWNWNLKLTTCPTCQFRSTSTVSMCSKFVSIAGLLGLLHSLQPLVFPSNHSSQYWPISVLLNFKNWMRTIVSIWYGRKVILYNFIMLADVSTHFCYMWIRSWKKKKSTIIKLCQSEWKKRIFSCIQTFPFIKLEVTYWDNSSYKVVLKSSQCVSLPNIVSVVKHPNPDFHKWIGLWTSQHPHII